MGIYDRNYYRDDQSNSFFSLNQGVGGRSMVLVLIGVNVAAFLLDVFSPDGTNLRDFLALNDIDAARPWYWFRILTAAFAHNDAGHLFGNMLVLFFFGRPIEGVYGSKKFLWMYLTAAIFANIVWLLVEAAKPGFSSVLGASGATTAVFLLFCVHFPHQKIYLLFFPFFGIPAWIMGVIFIGQDVLGQLGMSTQEGVNVAFLVHLSGAAYAYFFYRTRWALDQIIPTDFDTKSIQKSLRSKPKLRVHHPDSSDDLESQADQVLRKLHEQGETSLSARERKILEEYSRRIKQRR